MAVVRDAIDSIMHRRCSSQPDSDLFSTLTYYKLTPAEQAQGITPTNYVYPPGNVMRYGAHNDGTNTAATTLAFQTALNLCKQPNALSVIFPEGVFSFSGVLINYSGTTIKGAGRGATTLIPDGTNPLPISTGNILGGGAYSSQIITLAFSDFTLDYSNLPNSSSAAAIYLRGSFNNTFKNIYLLSSLPYTAAFSISLSRGVYTTTFDRVDGLGLQLHSDNTDRVTTVNCTACTWSFLDIANALVINFGGGTAIQGASAAHFPTNKIQINGCYNVTFIGCDFEGDAGNTLFTIANSVGVVSFNNNLDNAANPIVWPGTYYSDGGGNGQIALMDNWAYRDEVPFTPGMSGAGAPTISVQTGIYKRIGRFIFFRLILTWTTATAGGTVVVTGLPVAALSGAGLSNPVTLGTVSGITQPGAGAGLTAIIPQGSSQINIASYTVAGVASAATWNAAGTLEISGFYVAGTY